MKKQRIALCGCKGHIEKFGNLINSYEESRTAVVWDEDEEKAKRVAESLGCPYETDYMRLLSKYRPDGVVITADNALHCRLAVAAANAGAGIFMEKPLCVRPEEAETIREAVERNHVKFYMSDPFVRSGTLKLKELIEEGKLGKVTGATFRLGTAMGLKGFVSYDRDRMQGGIMADNGGHMIHKAYFLFGKPDSLAAITQSFTQKARENGIEEMAQVTFHYPDGKLVQLDCSWVDGGEMNTEAVYGTEGCAFVTPKSREEGDEVVTLLSGRDHRTVYEDLPENPKRHIRYFVEMLAYDYDNDQVGRDPASNSGVSLTDAVEYVNLIDAIYQNANRGLVSL